MGHFVFHDPLWLLLLLALPLAWWLRQRQRVDTWETVLLAVQSPELL